MLKKCSYFGGVHLLEVFTFGGFTVLCPAELVYVQLNLKLCPTILLTEVGMYGIVGVGYNNTRFITAMNQYFPEDGMYQMFYNRHYIDTWGVGLSYRNFRYISTTSSVLPNYPFLLVLVSY